MSTNFMAWPDAKRTGDASARVLVRGAGDVGSLVALTLAKAGHRVLLHDRARPSYGRRGAAFTDAFFEPCAAFAGIVARRADSLDSMKEAWSRSEIAACDRDLQDVLREAHPDVLVDARMRKHLEAERQRELAPLTIGLGPGFQAGTHVHLVIETKWGSETGRVIRAGTAAELEGEPTLLAGRGRERFVYAPVAGRFTTEFRIGDRVWKGEAVGAIAGQPMSAPLDGFLRGLAHDGADVELGAKVVEVDAGDDPKRAWLIGERPRRIAQGVLEAMSEARDIGVGDRRRGFSARMSRRPRRISRHASATRPI